VSAETAELSSITSPTNLLASSGLLRGGVCGQAARQRLELAPLRFAPQRAKLALVPLGLLLVALAVCIAPGLRASRGAIEGAAQTS